MFYIFLAIGKGSKLIDPSSESVLVCDGLSMTSTED